MYCSKTPRGPVFRHKVERKINNCPQTCVLLIELGSVSSFKDYNSTGANIKFKSSDGPPVHSHTIHKHTTRSAERHERDAFQSRFIASDH